LVPWTYFATSLQGSTRSILDSKNIINQISFPKHLLPISTVFANLLGIVFAFLKTGLRAIKGSNEERALKIGLFFAGCAFLFHNLIDVSFYFGQVSFFWWIILGLFANPSLKNA
jgi:ABC-type polysaccharide/polyol phosphate export permease